MIIINYAINLLEPRLDANEHLDTFGLSLIFWRKGWGRRLRDLKKTACGSAGHTVGVTCHVAFSDIREKNTYCTSYLIRVAQMDISRPSKIWSRSNSNQLHRQSLHLLPHYIYYMGPALCETSCSSIFLLLWQKFTHQPTFFLSALDYWTKKWFSYATYNL